MCAHSCPGGAAVETVDHDQQRNLVNRIIAEHRMWLAHARDHAGEHRAASRGFVDAIRADPTRVRLYGYCVRA